MKTTQQTVRVGGLVRHAGDLYKVLAVSKHFATLEHFYAFTQVDVPLEQL